MTTAFDKNVFNKFRALAITDVSDLEIGRSYYTNSFPQKFVLKELVTNSEAYERLNLPYTKSNANEIAWIINDTNIRMSLMDNNIGASYNPWLIFASEEVAEACRNELVVDIYSSKEYYEDDFYTMPHPTY